MTARRRFYKTRRIIFQPVQASIDAAIWATVLPAFFEVSGPTSDKQVGIDLGQPGLVFEKTCDRFDNRLNRTEIRHILRHKLAAREDID